MLLNFGTQNSGNNGAAGGSGGAGGMGGRGGNAGSGVKGAGGGGAVEVVARGAVVVGGVMSVRGADMVDDGSWYRSPGSSGLAGAAGRAGEIAVSVPGRMSTGGSGGRGNNGGGGADGGDGGYGAYGGTGGGGTVRIVAARIVDERPTVVTEGGRPVFSNNPTGASGRFYYGSNENDRLRYASGAVVGNIVIDDTTGRAYGTRAANPFIRLSSGASVQTPFITSWLANGTELLAAGAERFGIVSAGAAALAQPLVDRLRAGSPTSASAALVRERSFAGLVMEGFDALIMVNLTGRSLLEPKLVGFGDAGYSQMSALLAGGWAQDAAFGGDGADAILALQANGMYLTFVPSDTASDLLRFGFSVDGVGTSGVLTRDGQAMYLSTVAVPEPGTWAMLLAGVAVVVMRFRVRSAAGELADTARG